MPLCHLMAAVPLDGHHGLPTNYLNVSSICHQKIVSEQALIFFLHEVFAKPQKRKVVWFSVTNLLLLVHTNVPGASSRILFRKNPTNGLQHGDLQQGRCVLTHHVFQGYLETASMDSFNRQLQWMFCQRRRQFQWMF